MILIKAVGGLGNQMFQYAFARRIEHETNFEVKIDISEFEDYRRPFELENLNIKKALIVNCNYNKTAKSGKINIFYLISEFFYKKIIYNNKIIRGPLRKIKDLFKGDPDNIIYVNNIFTHLDLYLNPKKLVICNNSTLKGYWQSEKYFKCIEKIIRKEFSFIYPLDKRNIKISEEIKDVNSISIHVRRGDYINLPEAAKMHGGICDLNYYKKAINIIKRLVESPIFYIFSDDINWCINNLEVEKNAKYINWNKRQENYRDMQLMMLCKHNIIANSTFSWWGAWLNNNEKKIVIAPKKWFNKLKADDIIPDKWLKI